ncbi:MAG TPA: CRISPR-associated endonuclease Cas2 [Candidatus Thiothrix moscowensis]|uniref:CRISPR-associated endonuclease Cas2 n=1 Tax=unclassified Thiothrix TaxID=2636184 RepID=UPI0025FA5421|nr:MULTISPECIES: CRISPR-associated endonuclease Cas2 [unclassified Thiothrix]HRJ53332.1 CRISPR-associated endonuclease Cas2 [Candidatus Thiothrix moscowensis]HRJ94171.1 CRISPR-associated endonuclease Cas2 [Candidatus Thiothrix moscowensis]
MDTYLACFDIQDDRNRLHIVALLEAYGLRVQKSVFEISVQSTKQLLALKISLKFWLEPGDDLRFYHLCHDCRSKSHIVKRDERIADFPPTDNAASTATDVFPFYSLLPLRGLVVTLRCVSTARPSFFHQPALTAFLRFLTGSPDAYDQLVRLDAPESGQVAYRKHDHYRFLLIGLAGSDALLEMMLTKLAQLPFSAPKQGHELPFADNWKLEAVQDMFSGTIITSMEQAGYYGEKELRGEAALWAGKQQVQWRWLAPALLLKNKQQREANGVKAKGDKRYVRDSAEVGANLLFSRLHSSVADLLRRRGEIQPLQQTVPDSTVIASHLFWLDAGYRGANHKYKEMGGINGHIHLQLPTDLSTFWWELLVLGQYLGLGQRTTFGWGRYLLVDADGEQTYHRVPPASSLLPPNQ